MFLDQRWEYLEQVRYGLSIAASPIELAVSSPSAAWRWIQESVTTRDALKAENARLTTRNRELELRSMRYEALAHENDQLRGLQDALPPVAERWIVAEVVEQAADAVEAILTVGMAQAMNRFNRRVAPPGETEA